MMCFSSCRFSILIASILRCARRRGVFVFFWAHHWDLKLRYGKESRNHTFNECTRSEHLQGHKMPLPAASALEMKDACHVSLSINHVQCIFRVGMVAAYSVTAILHWAEWQIQGGKWPRYGSNLTAGGLAFRPWVFLLDSLTLIDRLRSHSSVQAIFYTLL